MFALLVLTTTLNAAPPDGCAQLAYCLAEARQAFCAAWPHGLPARLTEEEKPVHALHKAMQAKGCAAPDGRLNCPAPEPARAAPPVDCRAILPAAGDPQP
ncbi:MAG: hypothetical protein QM698_01030 [Micropepsaceae bacterium]